MAYCLYDFMRKCQFIFSFLNKSMFFKDNNLLLGQDSGKLVSWDIRESIDTASKSQEFASGGRTESGEFVEDIASHGFTPSGSIKSDGCPMRFIPEALDEHEFE